MNDSVLQEWRRKFNYRQTDIHQESGQRRNSVTSQAFFQRAG